MNDGRNAKELPCIIGNLHIHNDVALPDNKYCKCKKLKLSY